MTSDTTATKTEAVLAALNRWLDATMKGDGEALDKMLTPSFTYTHATSAATDGREKWLDIFRLKDRTYRVWQVFDLAVDLFPGTAVITGRGHQEIVRNTGVEVELNTRFLCVWIEQGSEWLCAGWQGTQFPKSQ